MIRYSIYFWAPPKLTLEQEILVGQEIAKEGREAFLRRNHPYLSNAEQQQIQSSQLWTKAQKFRVVIFATLFFAVALIFAGPMILIGLLAAIPILALSGFSLFVSRNRFRQWVDEMIQKYETHAARQRLLR